ncbi:MAG: MarR family winged helix-turn-helix transcriptional regulator [Sediminispirochaetaceae bacterium]
MTQSLKLFINLSKILTESSRRFTGGLDGLGFNEFVILYHLSLAPEEKMRRIDLAEKMGLTPSGVTRLLAPMEKIGLITREAAARDARVSYVKITDSGKRNLSESMDRAEQLAEDIFPAAHGDAMASFCEFIAGRGGSVR